MADLRERLFSRLIIDPSGCLLWTGATDQNGYGRIAIGSRTDKSMRARLVHRVMWEMFNGPIPAGLVPDHLCRVPRCASLAHLELVTPRENTMRGLSPSAFNAVKTECLQGHPFDEANTYVDSRGSRQCRACRAAYQRALRARRSAS